METVKNNIETCKCFFHFLQFSNIGTERYYRAHPWLEGNMFSFFDFLCLVKYITSH